MKIEIGIANHIYENESEIIAPIVSFVEFISLIIYGTIALEIGTVVMENIDNAYIHIPQFGFYLN